MCIPTAIFALFSWMAFVIMALTSVTFFIMTPSGVAFLFIELLFKGALLLSVFSLIRYIALMKWGGT